MVRLPVMPVSVERVQCRILGLGRTTVVIKMNKSLMNSLY